MGRRVYSDTQVTARVVGVELVASIDVVEEPLPGAFSRC